MLFDSSLFQIFSYEKNANYFFLFVNEFENFYQYPVNSAAMKTAADFTPPQNCDPESQISRKVSNPHS